MIFFFHLFAGNKLIPTAWPRSFAWLENATNDFRQNAARWRLALMWWPANVGVVRRGTFVTKWGSRISRERFDLVWITNFFTNLYTSRFYNHTGYDVTIYFRSEVIAKKPSKMPPQTTSGGISWISKFHAVVGDNWPHTPAGYDVTSCFRSAPKCNWLNTAQKWCVKRVRPVKRVK